jgi:hypothetical protein
MLRFVQRLNHRNAVRGNLDALLMMYPRKRQFERDFPSLRKLIREDFEKGVSPTSSAVSIAAGIITSLLEQLKETERSEVAQSLDASDPDEIEKLAERRIGGERDQRGDNIFFATRLCGVALLMAGRMTTAGTLRREERDHLAVTIASNLRARDGSRFAHITESPLKAR